MSTQVIGERFEIERLVGTGGMGEVFRARDRLTGGLVAVKVLFGSFAKDAERFRREAQLLAELSHPRIVKYVAHGITPVASSPGLADAGPMSGTGGRAYLAMEWLEGEDLSDRLERRGLTLHETLAVGRRTSEALAILHDRGIVHRDIKPSNLYLPNKDVDQLKLLDLGVARLVHASRPSTRSGVMVGTPGYMAPEQARGSKDVDARADVFSLGCVLYEGLVGRPAFAGENVAALLAKILLETPLRLRECEVDVPAELDDLIARMLSKHPQQRPANGAAVLRALDAFAQVRDAPPVHRPSAGALRALTGSERRLVSIVMAAFPDDGGEGAPRLDDLDSAGPAETLAATFDPRAVVASFGAAAEILADGSIVVTLAGKGSAGDQAAHAARCALALRSHLVSAQVALATGLSTTDGGGDVIERVAKILAAARSRVREVSLETAHGHSPVFLDETTAGLLDMQFDVGGDERGLFIRGLRERESKARTLLGKPTPFVGRDRELSTLLGIFEESIDEPVARAVLLTGPPGAGKSRLTTEFTRRVREVGEERTGKHVEVWLARGDAMSEGSPFSLLARLVRRAAGISAGEQLIARQQKLKARVARNVAESEVTRVTEFLGELTGVHFPEAGSLQLRAARQDAILMGDQMRRAFCDMILAETASAPLVLVIEDMHWGDLPSVSFLDTALRAASERPLMVLAVARGEVHESFPNLWEQRSLQEIRLGPLVRRAGERLAREVLGEQVSAQEIGRLLDRAAGNVFYLEELIRAYAEDGARGNAPLPSQSSPSLLKNDEAWAMPGTVLAMVEARLERLDPMARRVLRAASIFGEIFWRGGVLALTGGDYKASEVSEWLSELTNREIVQRREVSRFPAEHEYMFRHAIVRDAAYQMLMDDDRELGHNLAGEWLETAGEHEAMLLGEHFERGGVKERAATFYARAAEQALEGNDFVAARVRADRAIAAGAKARDLGRLRVVLAEASRWSGEHDVALDHARGALQELEPGDDVWYFAVAETLLATLTVGLVDEARTVLRGLVLHCSMTGFSSARIVSSARIAERLIQNGLLEEADSLLAPIVANAGDIVEREPATRGFVLSARVMRAKWDGEHENAANLAQEAVAAFDLVGDVRNAARMRDQAGYALFELGQFPTAERVFREAIESAERLGLASVANEARLNLGHLYSRTMRFDDAVTTLSDVITRFASQRDRVGEGRARGYLAGAYHFVKDYRASEREARLADPLLEHAPSYRAALLGFIAITLAERGDSVEATYAAGSEAMRLLRQTGGAAEGESIVRIGYAEALYAKGDVAGARAAIAEARDRLVARADRIKNPAYRRGFLTAIQEHVRTLSRAGEWLT